MPTSENVAHPKILAEICRLGIKRVVHFLPMNNLVGVLHAKALLCTARLPNCEKVRYVYEQNTRERWDKQWTQFVSLSIERINLEFFLASQKKWQTEDNRWCILCFEPAILAHDGVTFATTNNTYSKVIRGQGHRGFVQLFAPTVDGRLREAKVHRPANHKASWPTDRRAEVLYPNSVEFEYLNEITVRSAKDRSTVNGMFVGLNLVREPHITHNPEMFQ